VKNSVAPLPFQLPLRRNRRAVANRMQSYFCRFAVAGQPISVLVIVQTASTASTERRFHQFRSHGNGKGSYGTELRQRYNGTTERQRQHGNGRVETRHKARHGAEARKKSYKMFYYNVFSILSSMPCSHSTFRFYAQCYCLRKTA